MTAQQLKNSILNLAISGKLVPQDPHDEPASKLVEQIRKEKDRLIKEKKIKPSKFDSVIFKGEDNLHYEKIGKETRCIEDEIPFEIPNSWVWVRLGEICKIARGGSPRPIKSFITESNDGINWIKISDSDKGGKYINQTKEKITADGVKSSRKVYEGDLLLTNSMSFGRPYILNTDGCIHDGWLVISDIFSIFDKEFLFYSLLSQASFLQFCKAVGGSVVKNLNSDKVTSIFLPLPPLFEQKRIVDKLEEILPLVEKYKENKEKLDELNLNFPSKLKKSILDYAIKGKLVEQNLEDESVEILLQKIRQEKQRLIKDKKIKADKFLQSTIFIGEDNSPYEKIGKETRCIADEIPFEIPQSWSWVRLGEICQIYTGDSINQTQKLTKYTNLEDGRCYIATKDVGFDGSIDYENGVKIPFEESKFKIAPRSSVLLCVEGGSAGKKIGYLDCDVCFGNKLCCFNPLVIEPRFIYYYLQSQIFIDGFKQKMSGIISGISLNSIKTIAIAIPPLPEQKRIVEKIESLLALLKP